MTVTFLANQEIGLVQLRELLQKVGLRRLEREATYAIEHGRTTNAIAAWRAHPFRAAEVVHAAEGIFRHVGFNWTTAYGLRPSRALVLIALLWGLLTPFYGAVIWRSGPQAADGPSAISSGIYRVWPKDRIGVPKPALTAKNPPDEELLQRSSIVEAAGWGAYFSLLSAFQIGWQEFNVGSWIARIQAREFTLASVGCVRTVSGVQSLLSLFLFAMWALTYFGRPFQ